MATLPITSRARAIMDLISDGEVASLANYANVELFAAATSLKYAQAFWDVYPHPALFEPDGETPRGPTNNELATFYINKLRQHHKEVLAASRVNPAADTARATEQTVVTTETTAEFKADEPIT